ncbi:MAG: tetratricopeptide repeat protein [Spirulinaceae cyanobacterium]
MTKLIGGNYQFIKVLGMAELVHTYLVADLHIPGHPQCVVKRLRLPGKYPKTLELIFNLLEKKAALLEKVGCHDGIPETIAFFTENQEFYLVREYISGRSLGEEIVPGNPLSEQEVIYILQEVLEILIFARQNRVTHHSIKPTNIIRHHPDGKLVLTDFGTIEETIEQIIHSQGGNGQVAKEVSLYTPPQDATGKISDNRDIYALGITAIQALVGLPTEELPELKNDSWCDGINVRDELAAILNKAIHPERKESYQTPKEMWEDLQALPDSESVLALETELPPEKNTSSQNSLRLPTSLIMGVIAMIAILGTAYSSGLPQKLLARYYFNQGIRYEKENQELPALKNYNTVIQMQPNHSRAYYKRGLIRSGQGEFKTALADLTKALEINPEDAEAYYQRGNLRFQLGDIQGAEADYSQGIKLDPKLVAAYVNRGSVYAEMGNEEKAVADYSQAIKIDPQLAEPYLNRCFSRSNLGDQKGAIADCTEAISRSPDDVLAYQNRGLAYRRLGDIQGAIADYNIAIQLDDSDGDPYYNRGLSRSDLEDFPGAIADYTEAIKRNEDHALAYYERGLTYQALGNVEAAKKDFQTTSQKCLDLSQLGCYKDAQYKLESLDQ